MESQERKQYFDMENYTLMKLSEINEAPYNPRKKLKKTDKEYQNIAKSLDKFGLVSNLVWNKRTGNLVSGHQRVQVLRDKGILEVPMYVVDVDIEVEKAMNLALNKVSGVFEDEMLRDVLKSISSELVTFTGFSDDEYARLVTKAYEQLPSEYNDPSNINNDFIDESILRTNKRKLSLKLGEKEIHMTEEEGKLFKETYENYIYNYDTEEGFITWLLREVQ